METTVTTQPQQRIDFDLHAGTFSRALAHLDHAATQQLDAVDFDRRLRELVRIRASQLNGCAYCIDMHSKDARGAGESEQRIYALPAWRETPFFTEPERAALAFTEAVTLMTEDHVPSASFDALTPHYRPEEIAALVSLVVMINAWNAVGVSTRTWEPGSYTVDGG